MYKMRTIKSCAGIGDNIWLLQKLVNSGERFDFQLPDGTPKRGHQIFDLLPQVSNSVKYVGGLSYKVLKSRTEKGRFDAIKGNEFFLSCNEWLESGRKLIDFLPDLPISYKLDYQLPKESITYLKPLIGIYGSAYSTQRAWKQFGAWGLPEWMSLIRMIHRKNPDYVFVIIGAEWDTDFATQLSQELNRLDISYENTVGRSLGQVGNLMKALHYAFYFPSGLPILSESLEGGSDCTMFYTSNISKIMGTWCDPVRQAGGQFKECLFCTPVAIYQWCVENGKV